MSNCKFLGFPYKIKRHRQPKYLIRYSGYLKSGDIITEEELFITSYQKGLKVKGQGRSDKMVSFKPDNLEYEENEYLEFCGYTPKSMMYRPSVSVPNTIEARRAALRTYRNSPHLTNAKKYYKMLLTPRQMVTGGINTSIEHLKKYWELPRNNLKGAQYYIELLSKIEGEVFRLPQLKLPSADYLDSVRINRNSHPGFMTNLMFGHNKEKAYGKSLIFAKHLYRLIRKFPIKWTGLYELSGRGKDINLDKGDGSPALTRIIMIPEFPLNLIASMFSQTIGQFLKYDKQNILFIGKDISKNGKHLIDSKFPFCFNNDWSAFDSSITPDLILAAIGIIRSCFPDDREVDRVFYFLASSLIHKYVVLPKGGVWNIKKGLPSGHPLTSLIETICNVLGWLDIMHFIWGDKLLQYVKMFFSGDDGRILTKWNDDYLRLNYIAEHLINFNYKDSVVDSFELQFTRDVKKNVDFLKRIILPDGSVQWKTELITRKLCLPEWEDMTINDVFTRFENYIRTAPGGTDEEYVSFFVDMGCNLIKEFSKNKPRIIDILRYKQRVKLLFNRSREKVEEYNCGINLESVEALTNYEKFIKTKATINPYAFRSSCIETFMLQFRQNCALIPQYRIRQGVYSYISDEVEQGDILKNGPPEYKWTDFDTWCSFLDDRVRGVMNETEDGGLGMVIKDSSFGASKWKDFIISSV